VTGPGENLEHEALFASLTEDVKELTEGNVLTIVHFTMDGIVTWDVRRDEAGTPRGRYWPLVPWPDVCEAGVLSKRELSRIAWPQDGSARCSSAAHLSTHTFARPLNLSLMLIAERQPSASRVPLMNCSAV